MDAMMCHMDDDGQVNKQEKMLNNRKQKSRDAARNRRSKENDQYEALAKLLPLPESVSSQLDKASIIRLTIGFFKYKELIGTGGGMLQHNGYHRNMMLMSQNQQSNNYHHHQHPYQQQQQKQRAVQKTPVGANIERSIGHHLEHALGGFMLTVEHNGHFIYVSDTIEHYLGLRQIELIGTSAYDVIHGDDHQTFHDLLCSAFQKSSQDHMNNVRDFDAMTPMEMERKSKQGYLQLFIRFKCTLAKKSASTSKSAGYKVIRISGQMIPFKNLDHKGEQTYALVATGHPLPPPTICELRLDTKVFVSRVSMDLQIVFCEGKIRKYMSFTAQDIVGMRAYDFYHANDTTVVQDAHTDCLKSGKCRSLAYRWMNKTGGWVWMQTVGTVISRKTANGGEENQILCVNYISSEVEQEDEMMHEIQLKFKSIGITNKEDDMSDYGVDANNGPAAITSDDVKKSYVTPVIEETTDKESYLESIDYHNMTNGHRANISDEPAKPNPAVFTNLPNLSPAPIPARPLVDEETKRRKANFMGDLQLADMLAESGPLPQIQDPFPDSPESYDMMSDIMLSPGQPQPHINKNFGSREIYSISNTMNFHHAENNNFFQQTTTNICMDQQKQISPPLPQQHQQQPNNMSPQYQPHDPVVMNEVNMFFNEITANNNTDYNQQQQPIHNNVNSSQSDINNYHQNLSPKYETPSPEYLAQTDGENCSPPYVAAPIGKESPPYMTQSMNSPPMYNNQQTNAPPPYNRPQYNSPVQQAPPFNNLPPQNGASYNSQMEQSPLQFNAFNIKTEPSNAMDCGNNVINRGGRMMQPHPNQFAPQQQNQINNIQQCQQGHFDANIPNGVMLNQGQFNPEIPPVDNFEEIDSLEDIIFSSQIQQEQIIANSVQQQQEFQQRLLLHQQQQSFVDQQMNYQNRQQTIINNQDNNGQLPYNTPLRCNTTVPNNFSGYAPCSY